jgi:hypothetical protein
MRVKRWPVPFGVSPLVSYRDNLHDILSIEVDEPQKIRESSQCRSPYFAVDRSEKPRRISHASGRLAEVFDESMGVLGRVL